ncbi:MAG TPA: hypothetical protein DCZ75_03065 [Geobacter sp.]|nr:hypothetical protein [Geobacter sp.]
MQYPVYLHKENESHALGATIPDFPGCFSAADAEEELPRMIQEAVELYFEGEDMNIPTPSAIEQLEHDPRYHGGTWKMFDIDLTKVMG